MKCPFCAHPESKVIDSRLSAAADVTRRRRECEACERRFTTYERVELLVPLIVKRDGRREAYDRNKVMAGLARAAEKRAIPIETLESICDDIEKSLNGVGEKEVRSTAVGAKVMEHLRALDDIAYVRFASVYRSFRDIAELRDELDKLDEARREETA